MTGKQIFLDIKNANHFLIEMKDAEILAQYLGDIEMERFIALIQREPFDYTQWRKDIDGDESIEDISRKAVALRNKKSDTAG